MFVIPIGMLAICLRYPRAGALALRVQSHCVLLQRHTSTRVTPPDAAAPGYGVSTSVVMLIPGTVRVATLSAET
jgi:hypothetical protein